MTTQRSWMIVRLFPAPNRVSEISTNEANVTGTVMLGKLMDMQHVQREIYGSGERTACAKRLNRLSIRFRISMFCRGKFQNSYIVHSRHGLIYYVPVAGGLSHYFFVAYFLRSRRQVS